MDFFTAPLDWFYLLGKLGLRFSIRSSSSYFTLDSDLGPVQGAHTSCSIHCVWRNTHWGCKLALVACTLSPPSTGFCTGLQERAARACRAQCPGNRKWELLTSAWAWNLARHPLCILTDLRVVEPRFTGEPLVPLKRGLGKSVVPVSHQGTLISFRHYLKKKKKSVMETSQMWWNTPYLGGLDKKSTSQPGKLRNSSKWGTGTKQTYKELALGLRQGPHVAHTRSCGRSAISRVLPVDGHNCSLG